MYSLVADIFITTGLISDPIELLRVVGLLHGDPVGRWISTRCFQWLALIFCVWHIPMWQATLDDIKKMHVLSAFFFLFFWVYLTMFIIVIFLFFFLLQKKKVKLKKTNKKLDAEKPGKPHWAQGFHPPWTTRRPLQVIQNFLAHCV